MPPETEVPPWEEFSGQAAETTEIPPWEEFGGKPVKALSPSDLGSIIPAEDVVPQAGGVPKAGIVIRGKPYLFQNWPRLTPTEQKALEFEEEERRKRTFKPTEVTLTTRLGRAFTAPHRAAALGPGTLGAVSDETLRDYIDVEWDKMQREKPATPAVSALESVAGLGGTVQTALTGGVGGPWGLAAMFGSQGAHDAFFRAAMNAKKEGKSTEEAVAIGKALAPVGAAVQGTMGAAFPAKIPATVGGAARAGLGPSAIAGYGTLAENIIQQQLGLKTPLGESVGENVLMTELIPPAAHVAGRALGPIAQRILPKPAPPFVETPTILRGPETTSVEVPKLLKPTERPTDAIPIGEAKKVPVEPTPRDSGAVGEEVRQPPPSADVQAQQAKAGEQPAHPTREGPLDIESVKGPEGEVFSQKQVDELQNQYPNLKVITLQDSATGETRTVFDTGTNWTMTDKRKVVLPGTVGGQVARNESAIRPTEKIVTEPTPAPKPSEAPSAKPQIPAELDTVIKGLMSQKNPGEIWIYHGEGGPEGGGLGGARWSSNPAEALSYGPRMSAIKIPIKEAEKYHLTGGSGQEYKLPNEWIKQSRDLGTFERPAIELEAPKPAEPTQKAYDVYAKSTVGGGEQVRVAVDENGNVVGGVGRIAYAGPESTDLYGQNLIGKNIKDLKGFKKQKYSLDQTELPEWKPETTAEPTPVTEPAKAEAEPPKLPETPEQAKTPPIQPPQPPGQAPPGTPPVPPPAPASPPPPPPPPPPRLSIFAPAIRRAHIYVKAMQTLFNARSNRAIMTQTFDGADSEARISGQQARIGLEVGTTPIQREAVFAVIEAQGDRANLDKFLQQASKGGNRDAYDAVIYAQKNWDKLQDLAGRVREVMDNQIHSEQLNGMDVQYTEGYVPHIYDIDLWMGQGRPFVISGGVGLRGFFKKGRTFNTVFDAIETGYKPKTLDVAALAEHRVRSGQQLINRKHWADGLRGEYDPTDKLPLVTSLQRRSRGPGQPSYEVAPIGYVSKEILPGQRIAVHEAYSPLFNALTGTSAISGTIPGKLLLQTAGGIKHGLLLFDTFHLSRIAQKEVALTGHVSFTKGQRPGQSLLEYADKDLDRAVKENLIPQEIADWCKANRADANLLIREGGLNVGRIHELLQTGFIRKIPGIGTFNKYTFEKVTRSALIQSGLIELARLRKIRPEMTDRQRALQIGRDLNVYYGNLGRQGLFKSQTMLDLSHIMMLAPQWVESMARTEVTGALQLAKGLTYDPIAHKGILTGTIGKGVGQGLLAYFIGTQLLNLATRRQFTWQNEEKDHKLDAWIPDVTGKSPGFFLSPFSVVAELTHDFLRYSHTEKSKLDAAMRIARNKASPLWRAGRLIADGEQFDGTKIQDSWNRVKAAAVALVPSPIPLTPFIRGTDYPGQVQRQLTASMGVKTEPAPRAQQQIASMAREFVTAQGKKMPLAPPRTEEPGYANLRNALRRGDKRDALKVLNEMLKSRTPKTINKAMKDRVDHPFTGSEKMENQFKDSLTDKELDLYQRAREERQKEYDQFQELVSQGI